MYPYKCPKCGTVYTTPLTPILRHTEPQPMWPCPKRDVHVDERQ